MPHETYWLPYPALLKKLGYEQNGRNRWVKDDYFDIQWWRERKEDKAMTLVLRDNGSPAPRFVGELQSEEEFLTLLRQVRWVTSESAMCPGCLKKSTIYHGGFCEPCWTSGNV